MKEITNFCSIKKTRTKGSEVIFFSVRPWLRFFFYSHAKNLAEIMSFFFSEIEPVFLVFSFYRPGVILLVL